MRFLMEKKGLSLVEYILGGAVALILLGAAVWGVATSADAQATATGGAIDSLPAMPTW